MGYCDRKPYEKYSKLSSIRNQVGIYLTGPVYTEINRNNSVAILFANVAFNQEESIKEELHTFWSLESLGQSKRDSLQNVSKKDGKYVVLLLWIDQHPLRYAIFHSSQKEITESSEKIETKSSIIKTVLTYNQ